MTRSEKLRGQLEDYGDNYDFVIACACGIEDTDGWREVTKKFSGQRGLMDATEFRFIVKQRDEFGERDQRGDDGLLGGGDLF
jgi:hypothetical protein